MSAKSTVFRQLSLFAVLAFTLAVPATVMSQGRYDNGTLRGTFILSTDGTFVSPPPPFSGNVLPFKASQIGLLDFDGAGLATGEATLTFHHPDIPFAVISRFAFSGTYGVEANGKVIINLDEFPIGVNGEPMATRTSSIVLECYIVQRFQSRCVLHTLISYQQGPQPRNLPVTMSGLLQRQL